MAVKYICPKCGRRFVDWGAEKMGFKCNTPECLGETLVLLNGGDDDQERPTLKRTKKRKAIVPSAPVELDLNDMEDGYIESDEEDAGDEESDEVELEDDELASVKVVDDVVVDEDVLLDDDEVVDEEGDDTFTDALDMDGEDVIDEE